jgi:hypothetical protein
LSLGCNCALSATEATFIQRKTDRLEHILAINDEYRLAALAYCCRRKKRDLPKPRVERTHDEIFLTDQRINRKSVALLTRSEDNDVLAFTNSSCITEKKYASRIHDTDRRTVEDKLTSTSHHRDRPAVWLHHAINTRERESECFAGNIDKQCANDRECDRKIEFKHRASTEFTFNPRNSTDFTCS